MQIAELDEIIARLEKRAVQSGQTNNGKLIPPRPARLARHCVDCGGHVEGFMVSDDLWASAGYHKNDLGCQHCLEKRLKRELQIEDFTASIINLNIIRAYRMAILRVTHAMDRSRVTPDPGTHL